jgi:hypothetical protein
MANEGGAFGLRVPLTAGLVWHARIPATGAGAIHWCRGGWSDGVRSMNRPARDRRTSMWAYYDRRVAQREPGSQNVLSYFRGLGVRADLDSINAELHQVKLRLRELPSTSFVDLGAGPSGDFTRELPGDGLQWIRAWPRFGVCGRYPLLSRS